MKTILNYIICTVAICVAIFLLLSCNIVATAIGVFYAIVLMYWGVACPRWWQRYWLSNRHLGRMLEGGTRTRINNNN